MNLTPLKDWILLEVQPRDTMTKGGLHIPEGAGKKHESHELGVVLAIGRGRQNSKGEHFASELELEDRVIFQDVFLETIQTDRVSLKQVLCRESAILAKVEDVMDVETTLGEPTAENFEKALTVSPEAVAKVLKPTPEAEKAAAELGIDFSLLDPTKNPPPEEFGDMGGLEEDDEEEETGRDRSATLGREDREPDPEDTRADPGGGLEEEYEEDEPNARVGEASR